MSWLYTEGSTKKDIIDNLTRNWSDERRDHTCVAHCVRGNVIWMVWEKYNFITEEAPAAKALTQPHAYLGVLGLA